MNDLVAPRQRNGDNNSKGLSTEARNERPLPPSILMDETKLVSPSTIHEKQQPPQQTQEEEEAELAYWNLVDQETHGFNYEDDVSSNRASTSSMVGEPRGPSFEHEELEKEEMKPSPAVLNAISPSTNSRPKPSSWSENNTPDEKLPVHLRSQEELEKDLEQCQADIFQQHKNVEFNINSPQQVAKVLYEGKAGPTDKATLQAMASTGHHRMAELILEYRSIKYQLRKRKTQEKIVEEGRHVSSLFTKPQVTGQDQETATETLGDEGPVTAPSSSATTTMVPTDPLLLVDASALIFRNYHGMPALHRAPDGMPTGAVLGVCNTLNRLLFSPSLARTTANSNDPSSPSSSFVCPRIVMVFDSKDAPTFRREMYPDYKANRPELPIDLEPQFDLVRQACRAYGLVQIEAPGYEADDVMATLATWCYEAGTDTYLLSADKDLMQLVTTHEQEQDQQHGGCIHMMDPMTMARTTHKEVQEKWGVAPTQLGNLLALAGDASDNVPGVPGIGPKIAAQLLNEFGSLEGLLENLHMIPQPKRRANLEAHVADARLSRHLVDLKCHIPWQKLKVTLPTNHGGTESDTVDDNNLAQALSQTFEQSVNDLRMQPVNANRILAFYQELGFRQIQQTFQDLLSKLESVQDDSIQENTDFTPTTKKSSYHRRRPKATVPKPQDYENVPF